MNMLPHCETLGLEAGATHTQHTKAHAYTIKCGWEGWRDVLRGQAPPWEQHRVQADIGRLGDKMNSPALGCHS